MLGDLNPGPSTRGSGCHATTPYSLIVHYGQLAALWGLDTLGFEPRAFRIRSGCDTTTPCALEACANRCHMTMLQCGALRWDSSPVHSTWEEYVMPLRQVASDSAARQEHLRCASSACCVRRASQSSALCACLEYPGGCTTGQVKSLQASAHARDVSPKTFRM